MPPFNYLPRAASDQADPKFDLKERVIGLRARVSTIAKALIERDYGVLEWRMHHDACIIKQ